MRSYHGSAAGLIAYPYPEKLDTTALVPLQGVGMLKSSPVVFQATTVLLEKEGAAVGILSITDHSLQIQMVVASGVGRVQATWHDRIWVAKTV